MKFLLIKAVVDAHLYSPFVVSLQRALVELGHEAVISDQSAYVVNGVAPANHLVLELEATRYDAILSFGSFFGSVTLTDGRSVFDVLGVKFVGWQLDHPIYLAQSLTRELQGRYAVYSNLDHLRYVQAVRVPGRGMSMLPGAEAPSAPPKAWADRDQAVLVAATWNGVPQRTWEQAEDSAGKRLLVGIVDHLLADPLASVLEAFNDTCRRMGLGARLGDDPAFDDQMRNFLCDPLTYVRNVDRIAVIRALVESGLPVTLHGEGWESFLGSRPNVSYRPRIGFEALSDACGDSRVVLNLNAGNGACERALYAAARGAAVVSDHSQPLAELFGDAIGLYDRTDPATVADAAGRLLETDEGEVAAHLGHERVMASGLWRHRAAQLAAFVEGA